MPNPNRTVDKTFLSIDTAEERGLIHRDYVAHCLRWSHVAKHLQNKGRYQSSVILDVGCGKEMPLAKLLYSNRLIPLKYVGVDANKMQIPEMLMGKEKMPVELYSETNVLDMKLEDVAWTAPLGTMAQLPNVLTCFEVLEHVTPKMCRQMLVKFQELTSDDCEYFVSTPCWNGSAAQNHINEMLYDALGSLLEDVGFEIKGVWGTFASIRDYEQELKGDLRDAFEKLREYYDTNVLAVVFSPLFPAQSRNCLWHLAKMSKSHQSLRFKKLLDIMGPWSQHPDWRDLSGGGPSVVIPSRDPQLVP